ncbi:MAG: CAP domain-containing protein [Anaerolineales bacterium]|nr:CAP domain-containing protein [Anaerolineales bacterium]MBX3037812.1 CAP domain-containing protein [Anaerolineales bacterium]
MKKQFFLFFILVIFFVQACGAGVSSEPVEVEGGVLVPPVAESSEAAIPLAGSAGASAEVPALCDGANADKAAEFAAEVIRLTNVERKKVGAVAVTAQAQLTQAAQTHSIDMACNQIFSHTGSDGSTPFQRIFRFGYTYASAAENVAAGYATPADVVKGWMASTGHKANMLNKNFTEIGIGYVFINQGYFNYWTMVLAKPK